MSHKVFSIHQPNYLPSLSYFYKMLNSDVFVLLDAVQIPRGQSFANRNLVKTPNGPTYLTIPLHIPKGAKGKVSYKDAEMAGTKWKKKHIRTLEMNYKKADHFDDVFPLYKEIVEKPFSFNELNEQLIFSIRDYLEMDTELFRLSEILTEFGQKNELIIEIGNALNADTYLSGAGGGKEYNDPDILKSEGIQLRYSGFTYPEYQQLWGEFEENLSIIDLLMNCGKESREILENAHQ